MEGFAEQAESVEKDMSEVVMNGFRPELVPVYKELVMEFAVCDRWFASIPILTQPNRLYVHSATSYGATENDNKMMVEGYPQKTIFESMEEGGFSFGMYYQYPPSTLFYRVSASNVGVQGGDALCREDLHPNRDETRLRRRRRYRNVEVARGGDGGEVESKSRAKRGGIASVNVCVCREGEVMGVCSLVSRERDV
ncbi:hypothetical protein CsSME_00005917 [Camellia sinensis var. sinensis]